MDNLMNNPILVKAQELGQKLGSNLFVSALQAAMMSCMAPIMIGAIFTIICNVGTVVGFLDASSTLYAVLYKPYDVTMNLIGLYTTAMLAYNYSRNVGCKSPLLIAVDTIATFALVALAYDAPGGSTVNLSYLGATGMFVGFLIAWWSVTVHHYCEVKKIRIPMPDVCPPSLVSSMSAILPLLFTIVPVMILDSGISAVTAGAYGLCSGFMAILAVPLGALTSVPGMFILSFFAGLMWCFGIHGTMIMVSVLMPLLIQAAAANGAAYTAVINAGGTVAEATKALTFYPVALFGSIAACGGTGNTLPLCIYGVLFGKSEQVKAVAKIGLVPGWFGINEPVTFGMPIMYNPILCIGYILAIEINILFVLILYKIGFMAPAHISISGLLPMGIGQFLGTLRWQNFISDYLCLIPTSLIWFPFIKAYDNQLYAKEQETLAEEAAQ